MSKELQRFYCAFRTDGAYMYFRNDSLALAWDHARHCIKDPALQGLEIIHVGFVGTTEPANMGVWQS